MQKTLSTLAKHIVFLERGPYIDLVDAVDCFAAFFAEGLWLSVRLQSYRDSASRRGVAANFQRSQMERHSLSARGAAKPPTASTKPLPLVLSDLQTGSNARRSLVLNSLQM